MDDLINVFVTDTFTEETGEDIFQAIGLFRVFNYLDPFPLLDELLMMSDLQNSSSVADGFINILTAGQAYLLDRHGITLTDEATLAFNNQVIKTLFQLQKLEDPEPVLRILETQVTDEEKMADILAMFTNIPETTYLQLIETIRPICISLLSTFLYTQESNMQQATVPVPMIAEQVKLFKAVYGLPLAVKAILDSDTVMGEQFTLYLPLFDQIREVVSDETALVQTLLFLLIYSSDGVHDPMKTFSVHADYLVNDLSQGNRLELTLGEMYNKMQRYKEQHSHEKA